MKKLLKNLFKSFLQKGFTLIELLVVIAVIGVLAAIVLLAVNPGEQLARGRDTGRISAITQLGRSLQAYYTAGGGTYPATSTDWMQTLVDSNDLKLKIGNSAAYGAVPNPNCATATYGQSAGVTNGNGGGYCYNKNAATPPEAVVYARLESTLYNSTTKCPGGSNATAWAVFSTADARAGIVCKTSEPAAGTQGNTWQ